MGDNDRDPSFMDRAIEIARRGEGLVEPNPMVGCVIVRDGQVLGEGFHQRFGEAHAEVNAIAAAHGTDSTRGATFYVTLEPCCYAGKTPPCSQALIEAGAARVVIGARDPNPKVDGGGIEQLRAADIEVELLDLPEARDLIAPFTKLTTTGRPWVIAKWAMTLDGKLATRTGDSQWISSPESRAVVHKLRGRMDGVLVGRRTALADDPLLTARPAGVRTAARIVLGSPAKGCQLIETIDQAPVLLIARTQAEAEELQWAADAGAQIVTIEAETRAERFDALLQELGTRQMTNLLVEGGAGVFGAALDAGQIDEVHTFIGPKLVGGQPAPSPIAGEGADQMQSAIPVEDLTVEQIATDAYLHGRVKRSPGRHPTRKRAPQQSQPDA